MYRENDDLILASGSPRRHDLLQGCGLNFRVIVSGSDETPHDGEDPQVMVRRLALLKAGDVARQHPEAWVLGADTTVVLDGRIMGKPESVAEAEEMLGRLQGRTHEVWGGFALLHLNHRIEHVEAHKTAVKIQALSAKEIRAYVSTGEPMDKAGAYAAQGIGAAFINHIEGSYTNVVGLPLNAVIAAMMRFGAIKAIN